MLGMGELDDQQSAADEQAAQAQALMQANGQHHSSPVGAALGGVGDIIRAYVGGTQAKDAKAERKRIAGERTTRRQRFGKAYSGLNDAPTAQTQIPEALAAQGEPFSYGPGAGPGAGGGYGYTPGNY